MDSSMALNPKAPEFYPRNYYSQVLPITTAYAYYNLNPFLPSPQPLQPPFRSIHPPLSSPPLPPPPPAMHMQDQIRLPTSYNTCPAQRGCFSRGGRQGGQGGCGGFSRQQRRAYDRRNSDGECISGEMRRMRIVEPRAVGRKRKPVMPLECDANVTTVMIRNIPNKYTRELLIEFLDNHCKVENEREGSENDSSRIVSAYDFVYLPLDFRRKANLGYAFVNFTDPRAVWRFHTSKNNQIWELFYSNKIREIATAKLQGKEQLMKHFENSLFACDSDEYLPVAFSPPRDGTNKSVKQWTLGMHK